MRFAVSNPPLSEHERGLGLRLVVGGGRGADDDGGPTVSTQGVLQDTSHLAVSVRDVCLEHTHTNTHTRMIEDNVKNVCHSYCTHLE